MVSVQQPLSLPVSPVEELQTVRGITPGRQLFGRYTAERILGRGGMGIVWLARDERLDRHVALKVLPDEVYRDPAARDDLRRETLRSLELTHPHIVRIHDFVEDDQTAAISMEYVDGFTLTQLRLQRENGILDARTLAPWLGQVCEAIHHAHVTAKLAHRDLKPANVMVNARGLVKITDFGIACSLRDSLSHVSLRHNSSGTLAYMSPQQMMGQTPSPLDDIYALGALLFELLTSKPPFYTGDIARQVLETQPPTIAERLKSLGKVGIQIPPSWEKTVARCLSKEPQGRPQSALEVAWLAELPGFARPCPPGKGITRSVSGSRVLLIAGGLAVAAASIGSAFKIGHPTPLIPPPGLLQGHPAPTPSPQTSPLPAISSEPEIAPAPSATSSPDIAATSEPDPSPGDDSAPDPGVSTQQHIHRRHAKPRKKPPATEWKKIETTLQKFFAPSKKPSSRN